MKRREHGFGVVGMMVVLLGVALAIFIVWIIVRGLNPAPQNASDAPATNQTVQTTPGATMPKPETTELVRYEDEFVGFDHPKSWKVSKRYAFTDAYGAYLLDLTAPVDPSLKAGDSTLTNLYLKASILVTRNTRFADPATPCQGGCKVYAADKISPAQPKSGGSLVVSDWAGQGYPQVVEYTRTEAKVGDLAYTLGLPLNDDYYARIFGNYMSGETSYVRLKTDTDFNKSASYQQLRKLVESVTFKTDKLPTGF